MRESPPPRPRMERARVGRTPAPPPVAMSEPPETGGSVGAGDTPETPFARMASDARELEHRAALLVAAARRATDEYRATLAADGESIVTAAHAEAARIVAEATAEADAIRARAAAAAEELVVPARALRERIAQSLEGLREALEPLRGPASEGAQAPPPSAGGQEPALRAAAVDPPLDPAATATARVRALELLLRGRSRGEIVTELRRLHPEVAESALAAIVSDLLLPPPSESTEGAKP